MIDEGAEPLQVKRRAGHEDTGHLFPDKEDALVTALHDRQTLARQRHADSKRTNSSLL